MDHNSDYKVPLDECGHCLTEFANMSDELKQSLSIDTYPNIQNDSFYIQDTFPSKGNCYGASPQGRTTFVAIPKNHKMPSEGWPFVLYLMFTTKQGVRAIAQGKTT